MTDERRDPTADGTPSIYEWFDSDADGVRYDDVNDASDSTYIMTDEDLTVRTSRFMIPDTAIPDEATAITVAVWGRAKRVWYRPEPPPTVGFYLGMYRESTSVEYFAANSSPDGTWQWYSYAWTKRPWDSADWTKADLNDLQIELKGISNRIRILTVWYYATVQCSETYMVVSYTVGGVQKRFITDGLVGVTIEV
jgi:hypothetical protein